MLGRGLLVGLLVLCGCDEGAGGAALEAADAGPADGSTVDGAPRDGEPLDATAPDAAPGDAARPDASRDAAPPPDLGPPPTLEQCFPYAADGLAPDYTPFMPVIGHHCAGTDHQQVGALQRVVFLGDSVTRGTPPARLWEWYRALLTERLIEAHGEDLVVDDCSAFGARTDDLLIGKRQISQCFPDEGDDRATLVIFTIGGNDIAKWAQDKLGADEAMQAAEQASDLLDDALAWFREPGRFPNGIYVVFANPYEYTDGTGDLASCELSAVADLDGNWIEGAPAVLYFQERFMRAAVTYGFDLVFSLEHFCGHGFHHDDPDSQCYLGPEAELWFDFTCIHPNTLGHAALADLFWATITDAPPEDAP